jgi:hypothetical protein
MAKYVLKHGGIKVDGAPVPLAPSGDPKAPTVLDLDEAEAAKLNGPKELWGYKGACLVPLAEVQAELAASEAGAKAKAAVLESAKKPEEKPKGGKP